MIDNTYGKIASEIMSKTISNEHSNIKTLDPFIISIIIKVIWEIVKCYIQKKFTEEEAVKMVQNPNFIQKGLLRVLVRKQLTNYQKGNKKFDRGKLREIITNELLEYGQKVTPELIKSLAMEYNDTEKFVLEN